MEEKITAEYVALAQRIGPAYNRFCHLGFSPFYVVANPSFGPKAKRVIQSLSVLPSDRWTIPDFPQTPFIVDGDLLFERGILPLTVLTEITTGAEGATLCVPVFFSVGTLLSSQAQPWLSVDEKVIPRSVIRLSIHTLAKMFKFNSDRDGGIVYIDPMEGVPIQVSNQLLQYVAVEATEADPICRLKLERMTVHVGSKFKGLSAHPRVDIPGQPERAMVFDPILGHPHMSDTATYRASVVPPEAFLRLPSGYTELMGGQVP